jgi:hypothetical protein
VAYVWHATSRLIEVAVGLDRIGLHVRQQIIWNKTAAAMSRQAYHWKHEPCWYAVRRGKTARWPGSRDQNTIWDAASPKQIMGGSTEAKFDHPTQKPVELMRRPILNHTHRRELVYDPFLGSGTTLAAAELTERVRVGLELDPKYVDVVVERWQPSATELRISDANYIQGISTNEAVKFQGIHGRQILIIADEAPGIRADIWDAIEGVRAGGDVHVLMLGNPVIPSGYYFNAFGRGRTIWETFTISAFDTPNLAGITMEQLLATSDDDLAHPPAPYLVTPRWVKEGALAWGPKHPMFCARVLGEFPTQSAHSVFSLELIERAKRDPTPEEIEKLQILPIQVGIDVAGPGEDETVLVARSGGAILETHAFAEHDPRGRVVQVLGRLQRTGRLLHVVVDEVGIGYNFALHLADQSLPVLRFNAGHRAMDAERFVNAKAESYWGLREWMEQGAICSLNDLETEAQPSAILCRATPAGKTEIESKKDARKRGQSSPDRAEALVVAFCRIVPREQTVVFNERVVISQF